MVGVDGSSPFAPTKFPQGQSVGKKALGSNAKCFSHARSAPVQVCTASAMHWPPHRKTQAARNAPDLRLAAFDALQPLHERTCAHHGPSRGAEAVPGGLSSNARPKACNCWPSKRAGRPRVGMARKALIPPITSTAFQGCAVGRAVPTGVRSFCRRLARQLQAASPQSSAYRPVQSLRCHSRHPIFSKYRHNAPRRQRLS